MPHLTRGKKKKKGLTPLLGSPLMFWPLNSIDLNVEWFHNMLMNLIVRLIGFSISVLVLTIVIGYSMMSSMGMSSTVFWWGIILSLLIIGFFWWKYRKKVSRYRKRNVIVECPNCHVKMTHRRFIQAGGCPKCHTDLYIPRSR